VLLQISSNLIYYAESRLCKDAFHALIGRLAIRLTTWLNRASMR